MNKLAGLLGLAVALIASGPALANGYGQRNIPAPIPVPAPVPIPEGFTYYLRGDIGWGFAGDPSFSESGAVYGAPPVVALLQSQCRSTDDVFFGGIGAGAYLTPHLQGRHHARFSRRARTSDATRHTSTAAQTTEQCSGRVRTAQVTVVSSTSIGTCCRAARFSPVPRRRHRLRLQRHRAASHVTTDDSERRPTGQLRLAAERPNCRPGRRADGRRHNRVGIIGWAFDVGYRALCTWMAASVTTTLSQRRCHQTVDIGSQWEHQVRVGLRVNLW